MKSTIERGRSGEFAGIEIAVSYIRKMKQICDANNIVFVVAPLPLEGIYEGSQEFQRSKDNLIDLLKKDSILVKDWSLKLPKANREHLAYKIDHHWTEAGHAYFSGILNELIIQNFPEIIVKN